MELGCLETIDVADGTADHLLAKQAKADKIERRMDQYVSIIKDAADQFITISQYLVMDEYFMKSTFIEPIQQCEVMQI